MLHEQNPEQRLEAFKESLHSQVDKLTVRNIDKKIEEGFSLYSGLELYRDALSLNETLPIYAIVKTLNDAIVNLLAQEDETDADSGFVFKERYIADKAYEIAQISNFITKAIPSIN